MWKSYLKDLCQHPMKNTIVTHQLYQSLFPSLSLSVSSEYEQLLVNFLDHLYDSFDAHHMIVNFEYANDALIPFVKILTKGGKNAYHLDIHYLLQNTIDAKIFYKVLYCTNLLEQECPPDTSRAYQAYFVNCIVKILQAGYRHLSMTRANLYLRGFILGQILFLNTHKTQV